jgi:hypothetical protein
MPRVFPEPAGDADRACDIVSSVRNLSTERDQAQGSNLKVSAELTT